MKKGYHYVAVAFAVAMVAIGLSLDLDQSYSMGGRQKILVYATPILILFIEMVYQMHRTEDAEQKDKIQRRAFAYMFVIYLIAAATLLFLGSSFRRTFEERNIWQAEPFTKEHVRLYCNFVPFKSIRMYLHAYQEQSMSMRLIIVNIFGNLAAFMPCAVFMPVIWRKSMSEFWRFALAVTGIVLFAETIQFLTMVGQADVDDLILNVTGACVLFWCRPLIRKIEAAWGGYYLTGQEVLPKENGKSRKMTG